jgi:excisionase family DNA binding protein
VSKTGLSVDPVSISISAHIPVAKKSKTELLTLSQAGKYFGFSSDYFRRLAEKGRLKARKVGHIWLTTENDVEVFLASREKRGVYKKHIIKRKLR